MDAAFLVPSLDGEALHAAAPAADFAGDVFTAPADVDACGVLEEFWRGGPLDDLNCQVWPVVKTATRRFQ
jgi:hypothetical protein